MGTSDAPPTRASITAQAQHLWEQYVAHPPPTQVADLWTEHHNIRSLISDLSTAQAMRVDTDKQLAEDRSDAAIASFLAWADQLGVKRNNTTVKHCKEVGGLGLVSTAAIPAGEVVVQVPRAAMLSLDRARANGMLRRAFERDLIMQSMDNVGLAMAVAVHRMKNDSKWKPYLSLLPSSFGTPLFYGESQLLALKPSPIFEEALLHYRNVARQFAYFLLLLAKNDAFDSCKKNTPKQAPEAPLLYQTPLSVDNFTWKLYTWSVGVVATRINLIPSEELTMPDGGPKMIPALIPLLDMANHCPNLSSQPADSVCFDTERDAAELTASSPLSSAGLPVTMFYGRRSNAAHLMHNGFVPAGAANPHDVYRLKIGIPKTDKHIAARLREVIKLGFAQSAQSNVFVFEISPPSDERPFSAALEQFAKVFVADPPTEEVIACAATRAKAAAFLRDRFRLLSMGYRDLKQGTTPTSEAIFRLKQSELVILRNALSYCEKWAEEVKS